MFAPLLRTFWNGSARPEIQILRSESMAATKTRSWVHMMIFAAALAVALFVVTDLEYPRLGLVRVDSFGHFLDAIHDQMR